MIDETKPKPSAEEIEAELMSRETYVRTPGSAKTKAELQEILLERCQQDWGEFGGGLSTLFYYNRYFATACRKLAGQSVGQFLEELRRQKQVHVFRYDGRTYFVPFREFVEFCRTGREMGHSIEDAEKILVEQNQPGRKQYSRD